MTAKAGALTRAGLMQAQLLQPGELAVVFVLIVL